MSRDIAAAAHAWVYSRLGVAESCAERLESISNEHVNVEAKAVQVGGLRNEEAILRYLMRLLESDTTPVSTEATLDLFGAACPPRNRRSADA